MVNKVRTFHRSTRTVSLTRPAVSFWISLRSKEAGFGLSSGPSTWWVLALGRMYARRLLTIRVGSTHARPRDSVPGRDRARQDHLHYLVR